MSELDYFTAGEGVWSRVADTEDNIAAPDLSYHGDGGDYRRDGFDESKAFTPARPDTSELHAGHFINLLAAIAEPVQGWMDFKLVQDGITATNAAILVFETVRPGWEWRVGRVSVSVAGASAAASVALYIGPGLTGITAAPDESYLADFANSMLGTTPSRQISTPQKPYWLTEGDNLAVVIANAAAGSNLVFARVEGLRRQKL